MAATSTDPPNPNQKQNIFPNLLIQKPAHRTPNSQFTTKSQQMFNQSIKHKHPSMKNMQQIQNKAQIPTVNPTQLRYPLTVKAKPNPKLN